LLNFYWHLGSSIVEKTQDLLQKLSEFEGCFVAIRNNRIRLDKQKMLMEKGANFPVLAHPSAVVSRYAEIGQGTVIKANAVINTFARVGMAGIVGTVSTVAHDCVLGDSVHISPGANLAGAVSVGASSWVWIGASVKQCLLIGSNVVVGAGAAVVADVADNLMVVGVPAKTLVR
jgi:sugar O-acyltransferase (sialic acid O-acetyltransferase NeuD family)